MTEFYITEDLSKTEIECEKRFAPERARYDYLFKMKLLNGFIGKKFKRIPKLTWAFYITRVRFS